MWFDDASRDLQRRAKCLPLVKLYIYVFVCVRCRNERETRVVKSSRDVAVSTGVKKGLDRFSGGGRLEYTAVYRERARLLYTGGVSQERPKRMIDRPAAAGGDEQTVSSSRNN